MRDQNAEEDSTNVIIRLLSAKQYCILVDIQAICTYNTLFELGKIKKLKITWQQPQENIGKLK